MSEEQSRIIRLSLNFQNPLKIKQLEDRMTGPSKNGLSPIFSFNESLVLVAKEDKGKYSILIPPFIIKY